MMPALQPALEQELLIQVDRPPCATPEHEIAQQGFLRETAGYEQSDEPMALMMIDEHESTVAGYKSAEIGGPCNLFCDSQWTLK